MVAVALGIAIGVLSGLFGVGGSSISTPFLRILLHTPRLTALGSPLPVTIPTAIVGGYAYHRQGFVNWRVVRLVVIGGVPAVLAGSLLTKWVPAEGLMFLIAGAVFAIGVQMLLTRGALAPAGRTAQPALAEWPQRSTLFVLGMGAVVGVLSGLLANGGGFLLVPAFVVLGARVREAAATSLPCVALLAVPGTVSHAVLGHVDGVLALKLTAGVIPATFIGSYLSLRFQSVRMRRPFGIFLSVFGLYFFVRELLQVV